VDPEGGGFQRTPETRRGRAEMAGERIASRSGQDEGDYQEGNAEGRILMTLLESIYNRIANEPLMPPNTVFMTEDDDERNTSVLISPTMGFVTLDVPIYTANFQILTRAVKYSEASELSWKVFGIVENYIPKDAGDYVFGFPSMTQQPSYIGKDDKKRCVFSFNFTYPTTRRDRVKQ
jgi:hypothetical protein